MQSATSAPGADEGGPWVATSADELLAGATGHRELDAGDGKSGSRLARVRIGGEPFVVKSLSRSTDWITRLMHDPSYWNLQVWSAGVMSRVPPQIDHTVVGMALDGNGDDAVLTMLMHDVGGHLIPEGDGAVDAARHGALIDAMAAMTARFAGWRDTVGMTPMANRVRFFSPANIAGELGAATRSEDLPAPVRLAAQGWPLLAERAPELAALVTALHDDPTPLTAALAETPGGFVHGDWKMGNLGVHPDGRTILLDWAYPGEGPCCYDLAWYLALNRARLPMSKEETIALFRERLEAHGVDPAGWFEPQMSLCLLTLTAGLGWEKALGDDDELRWWERAALEAAGLL